MVVNTTRLFRTRRSFPPCTFPIRRETRLSLSSMGIELEAIDDAHNVIIFEDIGNGQTKLTFIGNEPMQNAIAERAIRGLERRQLDKLAAVVARIGADEIRS